jgi:hypothetical protein
VVLNLTFYGLTWFVKVTQDAPDFGGVSFSLFFLIELYFFIVYVFSHIVKKMVLEKNHLLNFIK